MISEERKLIDSCFQKAISQKHFDVVKAEQHMQNSGILLKSPSVALEEIKNFFKTNNEASSLYFSCYFMYMLRENNITCNLVILQDPNRFYSHDGKYYCVCFKFSEGSFIADPARSVIHQTGFNNCYLDIDEYAGANNQLLKMTYPFSYSSYNRNFAYFI